VAVDCQTAQFAQPPVHLDRFGGVLVHWAAARSRIEGVAGKPIFKRMYISRAADDATMRSHLTRRLMALAARTASSIVTASQTPAKRLLLLRRKRRHLMTCPRCRRR